MTEEDTDGVTVRVAPVFLPDRSEPVKGRWVWAYTVTVENNRSAPVQLIARHWRIFDAAGRVQEVRGQGVVGEQPMIKPGGCYTYTSGAPLATPSGLMMGAYTMRDEDGSTFEVAIPAFSLDSPDEERVRN